MVSNTPNRIEELFEFITKHMNRFDRYASEDQKIDVGFDKYGSYAFVAHNNPDPAVFKQLIDESHNNGKNFVLNPLDGKPHSLDEITQWIGGREIAPYAFMAMCVATGLCTLIKTDDKRVYIRAITPEHRPSQRSGRKDHPGIGDPQGGMSP